VTARKIRKRDLTLQLAVSHIQESQNNIIIMTSLCEISNASQRTLDYAFRERYGLTSQEYMLVQRLNNVRKTVAPCCAGE